MVFHAPHPLPSSHFPNMPPDRKLTLEELGRPDAQTHLHGPKRPIVVMLDDVRSRHNVGSIFRTADAFGVSEVVLCGFTPQPPHREIEKSALGATRSVPWRHEPDAAVAIRMYKAKGYRTVAVEQTVQAIPLGELPPAGDPPLVLVFGNELTGVSDAVVSACDAAVVIPQFGHKHSLNVSVCAGVVLWWAIGGPQTR
jgi:23S rRNA (guanosine2251-2'-O)-methyltransferase